MINPENFFYHTFLSGRLPDHIFFSQPQTPPPTIPLPLLPSPPTCNLWDPIEYGCVYVCIIKWKLNLL